MAQSLGIAVLPTPLAICRLAPTDAIPAWALSARTFLTVSRTPDELSIVAEETVIPAGVDARRGYRALRVDGPLPLDLVGVVAAIAAPLATAGVPIFPIATHDTDYILVQHEKLATALQALAATGHRISG